MPGNKTGTVTGLEAAFEDLDPAVEYTVSVVASGTGTKSNSPAETVTVNTDKRKLATPVPVRKGVVRAGTGSGQKAFDVEWPPIDGATSYDVKSGAHRPTGTATDVGGKMMVTFDNMPAGETHTVSVTAKGATATTKNSTAGTVDVVVSA